MLGRARIIPVSVFLLTAFFSTLGAPPSHAASCPGVPAPSSDGNAFAGVVYDAVGGVMKTCVGSTWVSLGSGGGGGGASTLAGLTDVSTSGIADGKALVFNGTSSKWEPQTISGGGSSTLATLTDVDTTGAADGKSLVYNATSSKWVPMTVSGGGGTVSGTTGKIAKFSVAAAVSDSVITESSGNIGIGVTPSYKLHVGNGQLVVDGTTASYSSIISGTGDTYIRGGAAGSKIVIGDQNTGTVELTGPGNKIISGNVGIGMTPTALLTLNAGVNNGLRLDNGTVAGVVYNTNDTSMTVGSVSNHPLNLYTNNTPKVTVLANGNVGIGTTSPETKLVVNGQLTGGIGAYTTSGTLDWNDASNARAGSGSSLLFGNATNGPGGAYYYHPFSFEYNTKDGTGNMTQFAVSYASDANAINNGALFVRGRYSGAWTGWYKFTTTAVSDYRAKENVRPLDGALAELMRLRPVRFAYKEGQGPSGDQEGFIAHELQQVIPASVTGERDAVDPEGNPLLQSVDLARLTPLLTRSVQELKAADDDEEAAHQAESARFRQELDQLKADNDKLRAELKASSDNYEALRREVEQLKAASH